MAADTQSAGAIFMNDILPGIEVKSAAWGDSMTFLATGVKDWTGNYLNTSPRDRFIRYIHFLLCNHHQPRIPNNHKMWGCLKLALNPHTGEQSQVSGMLISVR